MDGKLGLALSGGGFRAALFHLGALARLAEVDLLRKVDVISTVSGGSIVGAYYYLKVKELLEHKRTDGLPPCPDAYVRIVKEIERDFLAVVQKNLRTRALWNPYKNARMLLSDDYSRSDRMSELYSKYLYLPLWRRMERNDSIQHIPLHEIKILPDGNSANVEEYNRRADFKIPVLIINATTLNTGHSWRFTSSWVGEPPRSKAPSVDTNVVLEKLRFDRTRRANRQDAGQETKRDRKLKDDLWLGDAVAASACVPGIFAPMPIHDLYWNSDGKEIVVELVDGGVFDNQGTDALYADCTQIICSDASGQMEDERAPSSWAFAVALRSNGVSMERVRELGFERLSSGTESNCAYFHLRECFPAQPGYPPFPGPENRGGKEDGYVYRLSNIRTDLDSFSEIEAASLMYDGYCLSNSKLFESKMIADGRLPQRTEAEDSWRFLRITDLLEASDSKQRRRLLEHLKVGKANAFKVFRLLDPTAIALASVLVAIGGLVIWELWDSLISIPPFSVGKAVTALGLIGLLWLLKSLASTDAMKRFLDGMRWIRRRQRLLPLFAIVTGVAAIGSAIAVVHVLVFDRLFLRAGRIKS